jgi:hypothetical protein
MQKCHIESCVLYFIVIKVLQSKRILVVNVLVKKMLIQC